GERAGEFTLTGPKRERGAVLAETSSLLLSRGPASPPRRGHTQQPRVAQRTLGRRAARDCQYPEGVTQRYAPPFVQPLRRRELLILRDPQGALLNDADTWVTHSAGTWVALLA